MPAAQGGNAPADGVYVATASTIYNGDGGATTTTNSDRGTLRLTGSNIEAVVSGGTRFSGTLAYSTTSATNDTLSFSPSCGGLQAGNLGYSAVDANTFIWNLPTSFTGQTDKQITWTKQ
jgi:hypothetical protein